MRRASARRIYYCRFWIPVFTGMTEMIRASRRLQHSHGGLHFFFEIFDHAFLDTRVIRYFLFEKLLHFFGFGRIVLKREELLLIRVGQAREHLHRDPLEHRFGHGIDKFDLLFRRQSLKHEFFDEFVDHKVKIIFVIVCKTFDEDGSFFEFDRAQDLSYGSAKQALMLGVAGSFEVFFQLLDKIKVFACFFARNINSACGETAFGDSD